MAEPTKSNEPSAAEIRAELERILASRCFEQAGRSSGFLRFVVEQTLAGQGERLKGYAIAIEVFGRPTDFDAQTDPLVRVEAGRLRRRLIEYYADEGHDDSVRIELPRGSYSVVSTYHVPPEAGAATTADGAPPSPPSENVPDNTAARNRRRWRRIRRLLVAAVVLAALGVAVLQQFDLTRPGTGTAAAGNAGKPPLALVPFENLGQNESLEAIAATLTEELFLRLGEPETLVVAMEGASHETATTPAYLLNGSVRETDGVARITARLTRIDTGTQAWGTAYDEPLAELRAPGGPRRMARRIAMVADPYGPIFEAELGRIGGVAQEQLGTRDCVVLYYDFRRLLGAAQHVRALRCFEQAIVRDPDSPEAWALLAGLLAEAWAQGFAGPPGSPSLLDRAGDAARHAMDIDGGNLHANLALTVVQFFNGASTRDTAERVLANWPENAEAQAYLGGMYVLSGEAARGRALIESAIAWTPKVPSGYYATLSLAGISERRLDAAVADALRIDSPDWVLGHVIVAAAAALAGRNDVAARSRARAIALDPAIEASLAAVLSRWRLEPTLSAEVQRGFAAAAGP